MLATAEADALKLRLDQATITGLYYYPIKSCAGHSIDVAELGPRGVVHDREFMVVDPAGVFMTQRSDPRLALIMPERNEDTLHVSAPGAPDLTIPIIYTSAEPQPVTIWRDTCPSVDQGDAAANWLSDFLGKPCRLVRMTDDHRRPVNRDFAVYDDDQVGFADGYPLLMTAQESLDDLNRRLADPLPMNRFRPNVVIGGSGVPFGEDYLKSFSIAGMTLHAVKPCKRCAITTTDQASAKVGKEPLKTLATFRRVVDGGVLFGQNIVFDQPGTLRVGDHVTVKELQAGPPLWQK